MRLLDMALALLVCLGSLGLHQTQAESTSSTNEQALQPISLRGFQSSAHHWRDLRADGRFIEPIVGQASYRADQVREVAANILLFQRANGGWPKDYDMAAVLNDAQRAAVATTRDRGDTSYDNSNIHSQVDYLARAYSQAKEPAWREACERGIDFILDSQLEGGGFPQSYPGARGYHAYITFNDGVMIGILSVLQDIAERAPHLDWIESERREKAAAAVGRAVGCILRCQIRQGDRLTGWCQQHDPVTGEPRPARTFELASICPQETTEIVRFLMRVAPNRPDVIPAIDAAVAWLRQARLTGLRVDRVPAPRADFPRHTADFDVVVISDPAAPPIWARHYEIESGRPVFAGRDGVKRYALSEIERERRTGTAWYGAWPAKLLDIEYPRFVEGRR